MSPYKDHLFSIPAPGVLANDTGGVGSLTVIQVTNTAQGQAGLNSHGAISYDPRVSAYLQAMNSGELSVQEFEYKVFDQNDRSTSAKAIVQLWVFGLNDQSTAGVM